MTDKMLKERFNREDIKRVDLKDLGVMYLTTLASLIDTKKKEDKRLTTRDGLYVFTACSDERKRGIQYFGVNGMEALQFYIKKIAECKRAKTMYCALGFDYTVKHMYSGEKDYGAEDLIICGDDYPAREDI